MATDVSTCTNTITDTCTFSYTCWLYCLIQDDFAATALGAAVDNGHVMIVNTLVKAGANVNYRNKVRPLMAISVIH